MSKKRPWDALVERIEELKQAGETHATIAKRMGVKSRAYITAILQGTLTGEQTNAEKMLQYLRGLGLDPADYYDVGPNPADFDFVPHVKAKLGAGYSLETSGDVDGYLAFRKDFLAKIGPPSKLVLFDVMGDSMEPTVWDKDMVLISTADKELVSGQLFAVRIGDEISIKRLERLPGKVLVRSDNPRHHSFEVAPDEGEFAIIGRVKWSCRKH